MTPTPSHHYPIIVVRQRSAHRDRPPDPFDQHLGPALTKLGTIFQTIRHIRTCCSSLRNDVAPCCNSCSDFRGVQLDVFGVSWPDQVLKREAERCRLMVPLVTVRGLVPEWYERHWVFGSAFRSLRRLIRKGYEIGQQEVYTAKFPYKMALDAEFDILDKFTGSPFTSAQLQMLTDRHLNSQYRHFRNKNHDENLSKTPWGDNRGNTEVFFLHDAQQADSLKEKWSIFNPPLTSIRDYLGEKMAFCLAWRMCWIKWGLSVPTVSGLITILYGIILLADPPKSNIPNFLSRSQEPDLNPDIPDTKIDISTMLATLFDNALIPYHGLLACIWTVVHSVKWYSETTSLQFQWGMVGYTLHAERERPGYTGAPLDDTFEHRDLAPGNREKCWNTVRRLVSKVAILFSLALVLLSFFFSLYVKFKLNVTLAKRKMYWIFDGAFIANVASSTVNAVCISVLSKIFVRVAYELTVFENHIFETDFKRSLTWKLFVLEFINTHFKSLLILFFNDMFTRKGIFGFPPDKCKLCPDNDCLNSIALNVIMLLVVQDLVLPTLLWIVSRIRHCDYLKVQELGVVNHGKSMEAKPNVAHIVAQIEDELALPSETIPGALDQDYSAILFMLRKMKLYSLAVLYSAACPLAPVMLLCFELFGHHVDRDKFTGASRRVAAQGADSIRYWSSMQQFVNTIGIITNSFIIAHVSVQGKKLFGVDWDNYYKVGKSDLCDPCDEIGLVKGIGLWILCVSIISTLVVISQLISLFFSYTSVQLKMAMRRERYETSKKLSHSEMLSSAGPPTGMSNEPLRNTPCSANGTPRSPDGTPRSRRKLGPDNVVIQSPGSERSFGSNDSRGKTFGYAVHKSTDL